MQNIANGTYAIDATHSNVEFAVKHMMITTVKGRFADVQGTVEIPQSGHPKVDVTIGAASIDTRVEARDNHLRSPDFFDVETFPTLRFVGTAAERTSDGYRLTGNLTIRGVTKPVTLSVTAEGRGMGTRGKQKAAVSGR